MHRRELFSWTMGALVVARTNAAMAEVERSVWSRRPTAYSVIPVVGDGHWIWTKPPKDQTGYLEPRSYEAQVGVELTGRGPATSLAATTPVPIACAEQKIESERVEVQGCQACIRDVTPDARQLLLLAPQIVAGQVIAAVARFRITLFKQYHAYRREQFPEKQQTPPVVTQRYLGESPGIQTRSPEVRQLQRELSDGLSHPWDLAQQFASWTRKNIRPKMGTYTGVINALHKRLGDCEEMSSVFLALCRASGIPARLVWVPNHNWTEIYLSDQSGEGHWLPVHTAAYHWFGWTGAHELVLQKGDRIRVPERSRQFRLLDDWTQWSGKRPDIRFTAELTPLPETTGGDAGPGARHKITSGEWQLVGNHSLDRYQRR